MIADKDKSNQPRQVLNAHYSLVAPAIPKEPELLHVSKELLDELGITNFSEEDLLNIGSGVGQFGEFSSYSMCYGGHQFGHWAGQLGDGRAINIAEIESNNKNWKFQLKGAGPTPYSRGADGFAVLRSSIREYLCSEAMHHLGVPTTRALTLVKSGDRIVRDVLYDGNPKLEPGALVCRVSESFIRFGNFEIFTARQDVKNLKKLMDYTINHHFSSLGKPSKKTYIAFFSQVAKHTKDLIIHWQRVGFVHGVMNTDNLSILGQTIDYGPYGWLEDYNPNWTPNTTDGQHKRYRFGNQPNIALWNLAQLANALYPLIEEVEPLEIILEEFKNSYLISYHEMMCHKLGLYETELIPTSLIDELEVLMTQSKIDMTLFYRKLSDNLSLEFEEFWEIIDSTSYLHSTERKEHLSNWKEWFLKFSSHLNSETIDSMERLEKMKQVNPKYVLRNYMAQLVIEKAEKGDYSLLNEIYNLLLYPYQDQPEHEKWCAKRPNWANDKVGCSMLSCSS